MDINRLKGELELNTGKKIAGLRYEFNRLNSEIKETLNGIDEKIAEQVKAQVTESMSKIRSMIQDLQTTLAGSKQ